MVRSQGFFNFMRNNFDFDNDDFNKPFVNHGLRLINLRDTVIFFRGKAVINIFLHINKLDSRMQVLY